jgi:hypothetical protein
MTQTTKFQQNKLSRRIGHLDVISNKEKLSQIIYQNCEKFKFWETNFLEFRSNQTAIGFGHVDGLEGLKGNCTWRKFVNKYLIYTCKLNDLSTSALGTTTWDLLK